MVVHVRGRSLRSLPVGLSVVEKLIESLANAVPGEKQLENTAVTKLQDFSWSPSFASSYPRGLQQDTGIC